MDQKPFAFCPSHLFSKHISSHDASKKYGGICHFLLHLEGFPHRLLRGDAFEVMRALQLEYDIAVLDPPPLAKKKNSLLKASRGYKNLKLQAYRLLKREGLLLIFSCSHHMD